MKKIAIVLAFAGLFTISAVGQGFLNLNFESAYNLTNPPVAGEPVSVTNALPDWTAYDGSLALSQIYYVSNYFPGASTSVELEGGSLALDGNFSVGLYVGSSISQAGLVPANAVSLQFEATGYQPNLKVTLGGQNLSYSTISQGPNYTLYGVNIPANFDGQMEALTFGIEGTSQSLLDDIQFLPSSVPEPSILGLLAAASSSLLVYRQRRNS